MAQDLRYKNNPAIQSLYAWFPDALADEFKYKNQTPKDVYVNLGSRSPLSTYSKEMDVIKQYHQEMIKSKIMNLTMKLDEDTVVRPPWALTHSPLPNKPRNIEEEKKRVKSAFLRFPAPTDRIVLKIPSPELKNIFDQDVYNKPNKEIINEKESTKPKTSLSNRSQSNLSNDNSEVSANLNEAELFLDKIQVSNIGKAPIIDSKTIVQETINDKENIFDQQKKLNRPKTAIERSCIKNFEIDSNRKTDIKLTKNKNSEKYKTTIVNRSKSCISNIKNSLAKSSQLLNQSELKSIQTKYTSTQSINDSCSYFDPINKVLVKKGHWKDDLLNRGCYIQIRPPYFTKIDLEKIKAYPMLQDVHYKASETYFYNTIPVNKTTFVVDPNFISENLQKQKYESNNQIKFSRNYAFIY